MEFDRERLRSDIADALIEHVEPMFVPEMKISLFARLPGNDECYVLVTDDVDVELLAGIKRAVGLETPDAEE